MKYNLSGIVLYIAFAISILITAESNAQPRYKVTELGTSRTPTDINNNGQVCGSRSSRPWSWENGVFSSLEGETVGSNTSAYGINSSGTVVGTGQDNNWAFQFENDQMTFTGDIGWGSTSFRAINDAGVVVGGNLALLESYTRVWGAVFDVAAGIRTDSLDPLPGGLSCLALDINNSGSIVGVSETGETGQYGNTISHACLWNGSTVLDLGTLGEGSIARAINDIGQVVGHSYGYAFLWEAGTMTPLDPFVENRWADAYDINQSGEIVGVANDENSKPVGVIWLSEPAYGLTPGIHKLSDLIPSTLDWEIVSATAINDIGQIVGTAKIKSSTSSTRYGFVFTPENNIITVNSAGDGVDTSPGDGTCATSTGDCTLRAAIMEANAKPGLDTIKFNIPGGGIPVIEIVTGLPEVTDPVVIDGFTQPSTNQVEIDGLSLAINGLTISAGQSVVKHLLLNNFGGNGLVLTVGDGNSIENCYIGVGADGIEAKGNVKHGIFIVNSSDNKIGDAVLARRNYIGFNGRAGVFVESGTGNTIRGNSIFGNHGLGIDLAPQGINRNDSGDIDIGANNLTNYPIIDTVEIGLVSKIIGRFAAEANKTYQLDVYLNNPVDASNFGDGKKLIQSAPWFTDANGIANFSISAVATPDRISTLP